MGGLPAVRCHRTRHEVIDQGMGMGRIPQDVIEQVLAAHDIVEVVGRHLPLRAAGRSFKTLCPFHDEKTPSFTVNPDRQTFKCFGCGKGGNVFGFLMDQEGLTFPEAVRTLARERGIQIPEVTGRTPEEESRLDAVRRALAFAHACFQKAIRSPEGREARAYLAKRGYDEDAIGQFGLGYAPPGWDRLLEAARRRSISPDLLDDAGLVVKRSEGSGHYDRFRHRVIFPIHDLQGRVLTFGARALGPDDTPKYLNGPETLVFKKANTLYALDRARDGIRRSGEALLMEGYTDVLMCHLHGLDRAVAGMGTAFTPQQARLLKRFAPRVLLVYDGDEAGIQAAERTLTILLPEGLEVRVVLLPRGRDIDEILLEEGREAVEALIRSALDVLAFRFRVLGDRHDLSTPLGRARAGEAVVETIVRVPSPVERDQLLRAAGERLGGREAEQALRQQASRLLGEEARRRPAPRPRMGGVPTKPGPEQSADAPLKQRVFRRNQQEAESFLLAGILLFPALREEVLRAVGPEDFTSPVRQRVYNAVLRMDEAGEPYDLRAVAARLAGDVEAQEALAGLPEDPSLEERIPLQLEFLERRRRERRRALEILRDLNGDAESPDSMSPTHPSPSVRSPGADLNPGTAS